MRLLQGWKQVSRGWKQHINSYTGPDTHWQRNLRTEISDLWQSFYRRAVSIVKNDRNGSCLLESRAEIVALTTDLCTALETFTFSRALVGGVALIISTLTRPNDHFRETLGPNVLMTSNSFTHERNELQSYLAAGLLRHSSRTGPWDIPSGTPEEKHFDILPRLQEYPDPIPARMEAQRRKHDILPTLKNPALARTEAQHQGLDILQILKALLNIGNKLGRGGCTLLIELLSLRHSSDVAFPDSIHAQYFGHLWTSPVPGRKMKASSQAADWADTLSIWIHPSGTLARNLGHRDEPVDEGEPLTDLEHHALMDEDSQRLGLTLLNLLNTEPKTNPMQGDAWKGFMLALSFSGDLLTSLTHAITNPLVEDLNVVSLQGVESLYTEFVEVKRWMRDGPSVQTIITLLISEGMLSKVLEKTCLYSQLEGSQLNTNTADLLLTLSLQAHTTDARIGLELSRAIHIY